MLEAMRKANLEPPRFHNKRTSFWVTFYNHTLMSPEAIVWLNKYAGRPLMITRDLHWFIYDTMNEYQTVTIDDLIMWIR